MISKKPGKPKRSPEVVGWREHVSLPELGIKSMSAKIDTGARTSALHAVDQTIFERDGERWVEFVIPIPNRRKAKPVQAQIVDERDIKNTGGIPERRLVIRTLLLFGRHRWHIDVSLANREKMEFDLILGRTAIRKRRILVDPGHSFVLGHPVGSRKAPAEPSSFSKLIREMEGHQP